MAESPTRRRLDQPRSGRRFTLDIDPETFGRFSERLARFLGTGTFLFWQTLIVIAWISTEMVWVPFGLVHLLYLGWGALLVTLTLHPEVRRYCARGVPAMQTGLPVGLQRGQPADSEGGTR